MPKFSAFTGFPFLRFSAKPAHGQLIFEDMVRNMGGEKNVDTTFDSASMSRIYADATAYGRVRYTLERAGSQYRPDRIYELLPAQEASYEIIPDEDATLTERRASLAGMLRIARGAKRSNVEQVLIELLGADFVSFRPTPRADAVVSPPDPTANGIYEVPGTRRGVFRLLESVLFRNTPVTVRYEEVVSEAALSVGATFVVDVGNCTRTETVVVEAVGTVGGVKTLTATFLYPHTVGSLLSTGRHPTQLSSSRQSAVVLSSTGILSKRKRRIAHRALERLLRGISTWSLTDGSGPFRVGVGRLGVTTIGDIS